jgi:hypothetical protein
MDRPVIKDKAVSAYVEFLESELLKFKSSPYVFTYLTVLTQIDNFNEQLTTKKIDLFADKDAREFDRSWKYMLESVDMIKKLDELRKLMSPENVKELEEKVKFEKLGIAEKIALKSAK